MTNNSSEFNKNPDSGFNNNMTPDTPRTDAVPPELDGITNDHVIRALRLFGREKITKDGSLESWINLGAYRLEKAEAEVERLRDSLHDCLSFLALHGAVGATPDTARLLQKRILATLNPDNK